jgi:transcriptional repressor NrdR
LVAFFLFFLNICSQKLHKLHKSNFFEKSGEIMKCPFCNYEESKVTDSRSIMEMNNIRRRRECLKCMRRFTTFETIDLIIQVKKRDKTYEDFNQEKLIRGLDAACKHSRISHDRIRIIVNNIISDLMKQQKREISSQELGEIIMSYLEKIDIVAYIRFACVYKRFKDIKDVMEAIEAIIPKDENQKTI